MRGQFFIWEQGGIYPRHVDGAWGCNREALVPCGPDNTVKNRLAGRKDQVKNGHFWMQTGRLHVYRCLLYINFSLKFN